MYLWTLSISPVTPIPIPLATHHLSAAATSQSPRRSLVPAKLLPSSFTSSVQQGKASRSCFAVFFISSYPSYSTTKILDLSPVPFTDFVFSLLLFLDDFRLFIRPWWFCRLQTPVFHSHFRRKRNTHTKKLLVRVFFLISHPKPVVFIENKIICCCTVPVFCS